ncbi:excalibur calcium-binding domain-containing protein [Pararhizobium sp. IMCC21322]|uniref:excalibur calcium-binding domain-containing protein n=1 Tax=Pararhizobium sp. IMCC21322 TaxID=3067903 RepID=UPI002741530C|nr:excalibur calcium-binding domain-containing protein [Pararhizobium sp. IMCC21322]
MFLLSPWPPLTTIKHIASAPNCDAARAVGLAPSFIGQPGYWGPHDRDEDGIACELFFGGRIHRTVDEIPQIGDRALRW